MKHSMLYPFNLAMDLSTHGMAKPPHPLALYLLLMDFWAFGTWVSAIGRL
jgi:hypothetical protein